MSTLSGKYSVNGNLSILNGMSCKNGTIDFGGASFVDGCIPLTAMSGSSATTEFVENAISEIPNLNYLSDMTGDETIQTRINTISTSLPNYITTALATNTYAPINSPILTGTPKAPTPNTDDNTTKIATTAYVKSNLSNYLITSSGSTYAPIDSPELTGAPKAPTPNTDDNTTKIATTAFVQSNLSNYLPASSGSTYAPIDSPILTGTPKAPTPLTDDSTTNIATTAYVQSNLSTIVSVYAPIDNPVFTGTPKAPTPLTDDSTTNIATTAYVQSNLSNYLPASSVSTYAQINNPVFTGTPKAPTPLTDDSTTNIATTAYVQSNLSNYLTTASATTYAPIDSPVLTGTPQAPTPDTADNTTKIATTAYVKSNLSSYAPINNPVFTGTPKAPTPLTSDSTTNIATTAYVKSNLSNSTANSVIISTDNSSTTPKYLVFTDTTGSNVSLKANTNVTFTPSTGLLSCPVLSITKNITLPTVFSEPAAGELGYTTTATTTGVGVTTAATTQLSLTNLGIGVWFISGQMQFSATDVSGTCGISIGVLNNTIDNNSYMQCQTTTGKPFVNVSRILTNSTVRTVYLVSSSNITTTSGDITLTATRLA